MILAALRDLITTLVVFLLRPLLRLAIGAWFAWRFRNCPAR